MKITICVLMCVLMTSAFAQDYLKIIETPMYYHDEDNEYNLPSDTESSPDGVAYFVNQGKIKQEKREMVAKFKDMSLPLTAELLNKKLEDFINKSEYLIKYPDIQDMLKLNSKNFSAKLSFLSRLFMKTCNFSRYYDLEVTLIQKESKVTYSKRLSEVKGVCAESTRLDKDPYRFYIEGFDMLLKEVVTEFEEKLLEHAYDEEVRLMINSLSSSNPFGDAQSDRVEGKNLEDSNFQNITRNRKTNLE